MHTSLLEKDTATPLCVPSGYSLSGLHIPRVMFKPLVSNEATIHAVGQEVRQHETSHQVLRESALSLLMYLNKAISELKEAGGAYFNLPEFIHHLHIDSLCLLSKDSRLSNHVIVGLRAYLMSMPGDGRWIDDHSLIAQHDACVRHNRVVQYIHQHFYHLDDYKTVAGAFKF